MKKSSVIVIIVMLLVVMPILMGCSNRSVVYSEISTNCINLTYHQPMHGAIGNLPTKDNPYGISDFTSNKLFLT